MYEIRVVQDDFPHDPPNMGERATVRSFNRRHYNSSDPDDFALVVKEGRITSENPGIRRRLETGTAFILSAYDHSGIVWSLGGEGYKCRWDTAPVAGILFIDRKRGQTMEDRKREARDFLLAYTAWCNGDVWDISVWKDGEPLDSGSVFGYEVNGQIEYFKQTFNLSDDVSIVRD